MIEGLSLLQSIPPTTANKQTQAHKKGEAGPPLILILIMLIIASIISMHIISIASINTTTTTNNNNIRPIIVGYGVLRGIL